MVFVFLQLTSLNITVSRSIHFAANGIISFFFMGEKCSIVYGHLGLPGCTLVKNMPANPGDAGDTGLIPRSGRSPGVGNDNALQYSCLGNSMDRGAW